MGIDVAVGVAVGVGVRAAVAVGVAVAVAVGAGLGVGERWCLGCAEVWLNVVVRRKLLSRNNNILEIFIKESLGW